MSVPRATVRLQFHRGFTFDDAAAFVPYFDALGVSHLYASPILTARPGSPHGYDVIDPTRINPELGDEEGLRRLVRALRARQMGLIVDIVPNHMAASTDNPWWADVLRLGRASRYASFFDIDWEPEDAALRGKVLLPILGRPYGDALDAGEIKLDHDADRNEFIVRYFDHRLPVSPHDHEHIAGQTLAAFDPARPDGRERLHTLLERQNYRLAWWRSAGDAINWRRFFDINDLVALRMEDEGVFEAVHATLLRLVGEGLIDGFRVDHVDGLSRPGEYCRTLRARLAALARRGHGADAHPYLVVEKILGTDEHLPDTWQTDGTTGYDFMDEVNQLLHDGAAEASLNRLWVEVGGRHAEFAPEERASRRQILEWSFSGQLEAVASVLTDVAQASVCTRDFTRAAIRRVLIEVLVHFPVYRVYSCVGQASSSDRAFLARAIEGAMRSCRPGDRPVVETLGRWLAGDAPGLEDLGPLSIALTRFQQLSAPLSAKAVEDTAFYRYGRLLSRNDVGFDAGRLACTPADMHDRAQARRAQFPNAMLATATHDHKRGEDVSARLAVLSEMPDAWGDALRRWIARSDTLRTKLGAALAPSGPDLAMLLQTIVGAWPPDMSPKDDRIDEFVERIVRWQVKALREAKQASSWTDPNAPYETAAAEYVKRLFADRSGLLGEIAEFARRIGPAGAANGLAQTLVKLTSPGMPDIYQGTEYWDLSLVDPDNRAPVDLDARSRSLQQHEPIDRLTRTWSDGRIKQELIRRVLAVRRRLPRVFSHGVYVPLETQGQHAEHLFAFARVHDDSAIVSVAARLTAGLPRSEETPALPGSIWRDTRIVLPGDLRERMWTNALARHAAAPLDRPLDLEGILASLPLALLVADRRDAS